MNFSVQQKISCHMCFFQKSKFTEHLERESEPQGHGRSYPEVAHIFPESTKLVGKLQ